VNCLGRIFYNLIYKAVFHCDISLEHMTMTILKSFNVKNSTFQSVSFIQNQFFFVTGSLILIILHYLSESSPSMASSAMDGSNSIKAVMEPLETVSKYSLSYKVIIVEW
jgi:hypothetical protein